MNTAPLTLMLTSCLLAHASDPGKTRWGLQASAFSPRGSLGTLQENKAGGSVGLHALIPVGPVFLRPRADVQYFRGGRADEVHARQALLAGLEVVGTYNGKSTGFATSFGVHALRWELESTSLKRDVTHAAASIGAGWMWERCSVELRYLDANLDHGRKGDVLELGFQFRF